MTTWMTFLKIILGKSHQTHFIENLYKTSYYINDDDDDDDNDGKGEEERQTER